VLAPYVTFQLKDSKNTVKRKSIQLEVQATLADYTAAVTALAAALDDITDLELVKAEMTLPHTATFAGEEGSNVDVGATFTGVLYNKQGLKASIKVPGFPEAKVGADRVIDVADEDVAAFLAFFVHDTPYDAYVSDGETVDHWESGRWDR
jgi:hypothetical protein